MGRVVAAAAILAFLALPAPANDGNEWIRVTCPGGDVYFSTKAYPNGISMPASTICRCIQRRWRPPECDMEKSRREWQEWVNRKNLEIINLIEPGSVRVEQPSREK